MTLLQAEGNPDKTLTRESYDAQGELKTSSDELALVVGSAREFETWIEKERWKLQWADADILFNSPRPYSAWAGTYTLEPNVRRFTVAKLCSSLVPQAWKGLFYQDPPMILKPRAGTSETITEAKGAIMAYLMSEMEFPKEVRWMLEQWCLQGTCIGKYGVRDTEITKCKRISTAKKLPSGMGQSQTVVEDAPPEIKETKSTKKRPFFEFRDVRDLMWDPNCKYPDIRMCRWVGDPRRMDFYEFDEIAKRLDFQVPRNEDGSLSQATEDWTNENGEWINLWFSPTETDDAPALMTAQQEASSQGAVHHGESDDVLATGDPLRNKVELLEYFDCRTLKVIYVLDRKIVVKTVQNKSKCELGYLSANFWNRPRALHGMGVGIIAGQDQRLEQGIVNSLLKVLAMKLNTSYIRSSDSNTPTQMIRTELGKVLTATGDPGKAYHLLETPDVPPDVWAALNESKSSSESAVGADQLLTQGSTAGPRSSMGRTAGGAGILANANASRSEGPLENFITQVIVPYFYLLDETTFRYMSDADIMEVLGEKKGQDFVDKLDMQEYHDGKCDFDVLAGSSLAAAQTMSQSLILMMQYILNPEVQQFMADVNGEYFDFKAFFRLIRQMSKWGEGVENDLIKSLTPEMKQANQQKNKAAQDLQGKMALQQQKGQIDSGLEDQKRDDRILTKIVDTAAVSQFNGKDQGGPQE